MKHRWSVPSTLLHRSNFLVMCRLLRTADYKEFREIDGIDSLADLVLVPSDHKHG
jgi:hypothetical protein